MDENRLINKERKIKQRKENRIKENLYLGMD